MADIRFGSMEYSDLPFLYGYEPPISQTPLAI